MFFPPVAKRGREGRPESGRSRSGPSPCQQRNDKEVLKIWENTKKKEKIHIYLSKRSTFFNTE
jgi:hypothetical protein